MAIAKDIKALPECKYLIEELGSEEAVEEEVNKFIEPFDGLVGFKVGVYQKAVEHGWQPPRPEPVYMSHLAPDYLQTRNWRWSQDGSKAYATMTLTAEVKQIGPKETYSYDNYEGDTVVQPYVDVTFVDDGYEEIVRMKDVEGFTSQAGKDIRPAYMATLWDNFRDSVGRRVKLSGIQVRCDQDFDGNERYMFSSGNFTRVEKVLEPTTEEDVLAEGF